MDPKQYKAIAVNTRHEAKVRALRTSHIAIASPREWNNGDHLSKAVSQHEVDHSIDRGGEEKTPQACDDQSWLPQNGVLADYCTDPYGGSIHKRGVGWGVLTNGENVEKLGSHAGLMENVIQCHTSPLTHFYSSQGRLPPIPQQQSSAAAMSTCWAIDQHYSKGNHSKASAILENP
eukprot:scaffold3632_cov160-Ochromonas_danica.AAC.2